MGQDSIPGLEPGDTLATAMLSPCVGGLVRTWTDDGSRLWGVEDPIGLSSVMGQGLIARTLREERRYREVALLHERTGTLVLQPRRLTSTPEGGYQFEARTIQLTDAGPAAPTVVSDLKETFGRAVRYALDVDGFFLVERGGWDAPREPFCLFVIAHDDVDRSVVETAPAPIGARLWEQHVQPGAAGATMSAPATEATLDVVPLLMLDACATWGVDPWDLAITYGTRD